ncbi:MAG: CAP domain-containing protein [Anaerolineae bacterium]|nr:CAP domain-containing protein [Anaerolineae bacterium]
MDEWLQLSEEDIERATRLARAQPPEPEIITITADEVREEGTPPAEGAPLVITLSDLAPAGPQPEPGRDIAAVEQLMFRLLNETRRRHVPGWVGTAELHWHEGLAAASRQHSADMLRRQYVAHVTPEGVTAAQRLQRASIGYVACGENIGIVYGEAAHGSRAVVEIHNAFMNQPRSMTNHRGNLLNPIWTHVGIGIAYNPDGALVATQNFISAPGARWRQR